MIRFCVCRLIRDYGNQKALQDFPGNRSLCFRKPESRYGILNGFRNRMVMKQRKISCFIDNPFRPLTGSVFHEPEHLSALFP